MDGENNGSKAYVLMDDLGGNKHHYFWKHLFLGGFNPNLGAITPT